MEKKIKKLSLSKLTVAQLSADMARQIRGGDDGYTTLSFTLAPITLGCDILTTTPPKIKH